MTISSILKNKIAGLISVKPDASIIDVMEVMTQNDIGCVIVQSKADGEMDGMISERDVLRFISLESTSIHTAKARDLMKKIVISCSPEDTAFEVMEKLAIRKLRYVPVVDHGKAVGVISIGDVVTQRVKEINHLIHDVKASATEDATDLDQEERRKEIFSRYLRILRRSDQKVTKFG